MITTAKEAKKLIGKTVWVIPDITSNSYVRGRNIREQISTHTVEKVGSKKITVSGIGAFNIDGSFDNYNCAYFVFESEQAVQDYFDIQEFSSQMRNFDFKSLSIEQVNQIKKIIEKED